MRYIDQGRPTLPSSKSVSPTGTRNTHLRDIALLFAQTGDRVNFKRLLIPCAYYLDTAYQMCEYLARLYPEQASAVAKVLSDLNETEQ
ncbi:hypothetical protein PN499_07450 [Kamptonema animale CS-326]|uniref:hypothetical protein n=1 Tax=Kamptonema animale TaxID=92934 RepID=UPI00232E48EE|nr:hypothetical protein [Kamptonema animale]MDB9511014.1 hypothetical protein [Kamptonema animale CS-326]